MGSIWFVCSLAAKTGMAHQHGQKENQTFLQFPSLMQNPCTAVWVLDFSGRCLKTLKLGFLPQLFLLFPLNFPVYSHKHYCVNIPLKFPNPSNCVRNWKFYFHSGAQLTGNGVVNSSQKKITLWQVIVSQFNDILYIGSIVICAVF